jgi:hypothetical protein
MLVTSELKDVKAIYCANLDQAKAEYFFDNLKSWNVTHLADKRVMVKGCSDIPDPEKAYVILTQKLLPLAKSLMFGEPCSAVPVFQEEIKTESTKRTNHKFQRIYNSPSFFYNQGFSNYR